MNTNAASSRHDKAQSSARIGAMFSANLTLQDNIAKTSPPSISSGSTAATVNTFLSLTLKTTDCNAVLFALGAVRLFTFVIVVTPLASNLILLSRQRILHCPRKVSHLRAAQDVCIPPLQIYANIPVTTH